MQEAEDRWKDRQVREGTELSNVLSILGWSISNIIEKISSVFDIQFQLVDKKVDHGNSNL